MKTVLMVALCIFIAITSFMAGMHYATEQFQKTLERKFTRRQLTYFLWLLRKDED